MRQYRLFVTDNEGSRQAAITGRLQTESEALSWNYAGKFSATKAEAIVIAHGCVANGSKAARLFSAPKSGPLGKLLVTVTTAVPNA